MEVRGHQGGAADQPTIDIRLREQFPALSGFTLPP